VHDFAHQLFDQLLSDRTVLTASEFRNRLCDSDDHFFRFTGIDFVCPPAVAGYSAK